MSKQEPDRKEDLETAREEERGIILINDDKILESLKELDPDLQKKETKKSASELRLELEIEGLRSEVRELREALEAMEKREAERDLELRSSFLSVVAFFERTHDWEPRPGKKYREMYNQGTQGDNKK